MGIISLESFNRNKMQHKKVISKVVNNMRTNDVEKIQVPVSTSLKDAMKAMDSSGMETILVIDDQRRLIGLLTDGDIRRALISDISLNEKVVNVMNSNFTAVSYNTPPKEIIKIMKRHFFRQLPVIDDDRKVVDIYLLKDVLSGTSRDNYVVLMAGGLGSRLRPLTDEVPKPMLKIGDKPILEIIIRQFKNCGFNNFIISINYKADLVEGYFGDGSDFDVNIQYVRETKRLGTAGCLKLISGSLNKPFFVMNGDILARIDFDDMLKFHSANGFDMTVGIRKHEYQIPYGIINTEGNQISQLIEKPVNHCMINAGIYCLNPEVVEHIPNDDFYDITALIDNRINGNGRVGGYHIKDYWMDIGQIEDYNKANNDYEQYFKHFSKPTSFDKLAAK